MNTQWQEHDLHLTTEREGLVVWDQKGLVVLWPDGHCSRFSWAALRQACLCTECRAHREEKVTTTETRTTTPPNSLKDLRHKTH